jgi:cellulose synthase/poly-beta-1,6-N-acetylglucosamine synthase-like glycosyltransferase
VDDGSHDGSAEVARARGLRVLQTTPPAGQRSAGAAAARNFGVQATRAPLLCFIDADVMVRPDTLARFVALFAAEPAITAAFGSYDTAPAAPGTISQYRNLLHHYTHQTGREAASTFWSGCGAIRTSAFRAVGGFDEHARSWGIEDIELGYRLRADGYPIRLAKAIQVTHLKRWTLWGMLHTDIFLRALPWTGLILRSGTLPDDLNVGTGGRISALSVFALAGLLLLGRWRPHAWAAALGPVAVLLALNRALYGFFLRQRGPWFLLRVLPLHWLYFAYSALSFAYGLAAHRLGAGRHRR